MAGDKEGITENVDVPARRGYVISRIESTQTSTAASNLPLKTAVATKVDYSSGTRNSGRNRGNKKQQQEERERSGAEGGGDRIAEGSRSRRKRGGKGRKAAHTTAGDMGTGPSIAYSGNPTGRDDPTSGCLDRGPGSTHGGSCSQQQQQQQQHQQQQQQQRIHYSPRAMHQDATGGGRVFVEAFKAIPSTARGRGHRGNYHHEHDDRGELPPQQAAGKTSHSRHQRSTSVGNAASPLDTRADAHNVSSSVRHRTNPTGDGSRGGGSIFSRLGPPPQSPPNTLSRERSGNNRHDNGDAGGEHRSHEPASATSTSRGSALSRSFRGAAGGETPRAAVRKPLPHPPHQAAPKTTQTTTPATTKEKRSVSYAAQNRERCRLPQRRHQGEYARGTCMSMCPDSEMREREAEGGLSSFEATEATSMSSVPFRRRVADPAKVVKKYRRSAAGRDMLSPEQLRPLAVLQTTACYLVKDVFARACSDSSSSSSSSSGGGGGGGGGGRGDSCGVGRGHHRQPSGPSYTAKAYAFVEDRLRAVRQDLTVQGLMSVSSEGAVEVLKITANFYIVAGYLMADEASDVFDRHLHTRELQGVFSSLAEMFFQAEESTPPQQLCPPTLWVDEYLSLQAVHALSTAISNSSKGEDMPLAEAAGGQGVGRVFTTTVSKLCSGSWSSSHGRLAYRTGHSASSAGGGGDADDVGGMSQLSFRTAFPKMALAVRLLGVVGAGNWSEFFRVLGCAESPAEDDGVGSESGLQRVGDEWASSPFAVRLRCLCHSMLLPVRAHALKAMNKAFGKSETVPLGDVARVLRTRDEEHAAGICRALSLPVVGSPGNSDQPADQARGGIDEPAAGRADLRVVFKSVPAVWMSEKARTTGYCPPQPRQEPPQASLVSSRENCNGRMACRDSWGNGVARGACSSLREDDWVGLTQALAAGAVAEKNQDAASDPTSATCDACAGFGCSWCDDGVVRSTGDAGREEEGLWEAALRPS